MPQFTVDFPVRNFDALDQIALHARQDYNLGGAGDWFGDFRGGLYGFYARLHGVRVHYSEIHAWLPRIRTPSETEYHLASVFFHMDSALECLVFAFNALGWAAMPTGFRDVTDEKALRRISPLDILGEVSKRSSTDGYAHLFPTLRAAWNSKAELIARIRDLHDVSKHRRTIFSGGKVRSDAPDGFYKMLGVPDGPGHAFALRPMAEVFLQHDPKRPEVERKPQALRQENLLENIVPAFSALIEETGRVALADADANVPLKEKQFRGA